MINGVNHQADTQAELAEIQQNNADYTLFSWSKQGGLNPIADRKSVV